MHLMSFGDAFGFLAFMLFVLAMMGFLIIQRAGKNQQVSGAAKRAGSIAARAGAAGLKKWLGGK